MGNRSDRDRYAQRAAGDRMAGEPERPGPESPALGNRAVSALLQAAPGRLPSGVADAIDDARGGGAGLTEPVRDAMEQRLGVDLSPVRIHTDARAGQLNRAVGAAAFTTGTDIFFGPGRYDPASSGGRELLAHELVHVVQQDSGAASGGPEVSHPDDPAEREARAAAPGVAAPPALGGLGAAAVGFLEHLQRTAGNRAVLRYVQRDTDPPMSSPEPQASQPPAAAVPPEQERLLLAASTTLRRVPALEDGARNDLNRIVSGAPVVVWMDERDRKAAQLATRKADLERMQDQQAHPPENGTPPMQQEVDAVALEVGALTDDVQQLSERITAALGPLGITDERDLRSLVANRFPDLFIARAKQIVNAELDENQSVVDREAQRYGVDACTDPAARDALVAAARDLKSQDAEIVRLQEAVDQVRGSVDLPSGGAPDPDTAGSSYPDLVSRNARYQEAVQQRTEARNRYALQHPVLLRPDVDLDILASGDPDRIGAHLGATFKVISDDIRDTRDNVRQNVLKVWNLRDVVALTMQDLGITGDATLEAAVQSYIAEAQTDEAVLKLGLAALAITAGIIATVASGGAALAAGAVAVGAGTVTATSSVSDFLAASAARNVALDPAVAKLATDDPSLLWLLLDIVAVAADAVAVVRVFNQLRSAAVALRATGEISEFEQAAKAALPADQAEQVVATAVRQNAAAGSAAQTAQTPPVPWEDLLAKAESPTARQSVGGFRSEPVRIGNREVVVIEGTVGDPIPQSESFAGYKAKVPGEHGAHAVGMRLGENLPEGITSTPASAMNLSPLKVVENKMHEVANLARESGGVVETQTITRIEYVGPNNEIPLMVGVQRKAWLRMPGSDDPTIFIDFEATVDPVTRQAVIVRNEMGSILPSP